MRLRVRGKATAVSEKVGGPTLCVGDAREEVHAACQKDKMRFL